MKNYFKEIILKKENHFLVNNERYLLLKWHTSYLKGFILKELSLYYLQEILAMPLYE